MLIELPPLATVEEYDVAIEVLDAFSDGLGRYCRLYSQVGLMHAKDTDSTLAVELPDAWQGDPAALG